MIKPITLSINPTYLCNFRCDFCYLTPAQLSDPTAIDLSVLESRLQEVRTYTPISYVDLYGGEFTALRKSYQAETFAVIRRFYDGPINVVTNYLNPLDPTLDSNMIVTVSYDFSHRERHERVLRNMKAAPHPIHVLVLASRGIVGDDVDAMIATLNDVDAVRTVEIKPYSTNQANHHNVSHRDFEEFVKRWITSPVQKRFSLTNEMELRRAVDGTRTSFSDDHLYITPEGSFAVLDFDLNDREFFRPVRSFDEYIEWCYHEKTTTFANSYCNTCEYLGRCLTEHIRPVRDVDKSCNGYFQLIKWYKNEAVAR